MECVQQQQQQQTSTSIYATRLDNEERVLEEFILCYKRNRVLWDSKCGRNVSRLQKDQVFNELAQILGKVKPDCSVEDVKKKINGLRSNYRRELRKVRRSEALAGQNKDAIFQPTLWWYKLMDFLEEVERPFEDVSNIYLGHNTKIDSKLWSYGKKKKSYKNEKNVLPVAETSYNSMSTYNLSISPTFMPQMAAQDFLEHRDESKNLDDPNVDTKQLQVMKQEHEESNPMVLANDHIPEIHENGCETNLNLDNGYMKSNDFHNSSLSATATSNNLQTPHSTNSYMEDVPSTYPYEPLVKNFKMSETSTREANLATNECDNYIYLARLWSNKLRNVEPRQRLYAEKAINDIIFEAELGTLSRNSVKINE